MASGPPQHVKRQIMRQLTSGSIKTGDYWEYAVSASWLAAWQCPEDQFVVVADNTHNSLESWTSGTSVDVRQAEHSQQATSAAPPMTMSESDKDNAYIPETHWKIFATWFGVDKTHQLRRRPSVNRYMKVVPCKTEDNTYLCDNELDFLPVWVARLDDLVQGQRQALVHVFAWETFEHIAKQVRRVLQVSSHTKIRIWFNIQEDGLGLALEPVADFGQVLIRKVAEVVPDVLGVLEKRERQLNVKYIKQEGRRRDEAEIRGPLAEEWFGDRILSISIGVEEIGVDITKSVVTKDRFLPEDDDDDDELESIVTIFSIRNEWDDVLSTYIDAYSENMTEKTTAIKENLLTAAKQIVGEKLDEITEIRSDFEKRFRLVERREDEVAEREKQVVAKEEEMAGRLAVYKAGLEDLQKQKQKFADDVKKIQDQNTIAESRVTLNIGGILYATSVETLQKAEDSRLATLFSGSHSLSQERDGTFFIDRDGVNFRYILNFLRDGEAAIETLPVEGKLLKELLAEARFYRLWEMEELLQKKLAKP